MDAQKLELERELAFKALDLKIGDFVTHPRFGKGKVKHVNKPKKINKAYFDIDFEIHGVKRMLFIFAELKKT